MRRRQLCASVVALLFATACIPQVLTIDPRGIPQSSTPLSKAAKAALLPALQGATGEHRPDLLRDFSAFAEPLALKGPPAIIAISNSVKSGCGYGNPNCIFLVFRQTRNADVLILDSVAGDFNFRDSRHNGYRDNILTNYQGMRSVVSVWRYDGRRYAVHDCTEKTSGGGETALEPDKCG